MAYDADYLFMFICHLYIFFGQMSVPIFGPFLNQFIKFLIVEF